MPEVIDNNKVGELIKKLLKERNMTQDDLAKELSISKSAVSQNLNGKSSFDIQNLITISKLFDISMEELLVYNSEDKGKTVISEYEKLVKRGLDAFAGLEVKNMSISNPDIYGNTLVEYVIEYDNLELFNLLHESNVKLLEETHHKARSIYTKIIWYALKNNVDNVKKYLDSYVRLYNSLVFPDEAYAKEIFNFLNKENYQGLVLMLYETKVIKRVPLFFGLERNKKIPYLLKVEWLEIIAKYKLERILKTISFKFKFINDYELIIKTFLTYKFYDGIAWYINNMDYVINNIELRITSAQDVIFRIAASGNLEIFKIALNKELYLNLNKLVARLILEKHKDAYMYCINTYKKVLDFQQVGYAAVASSNLELLKYIIKNLNQNDLNYILSVTDAKDLDIIEYLINNGALFEVEYYNSNTMKKVNKIIDKLSKGVEDASNNR